MTNAAQINSGPQMCHAPSGGDGDQTLVGVVCGEVRSGKQTICHLSFHICHLSLKPQGDCIYVSHAKSGAESHAKLR